MRSSSFAAHTGPFFAFLALLSLVPLFGQPAGPFWRVHPEFWVYPLQTVVCGALLIWWRGNYRFRPFGTFVFCIGALTGAIVFVVWISPQIFFHAAPRLAGFDPTLVTQSGAVYAATFLLRFMRLVIVVPFIEEIFWRGFLLRYLVREDFESVAMGTFTWISFTVVSIAFMFEHAWADWPAALVSGALFNLVGYQTRSLFACVVAHAIANLLLGAYVVSTGQWGFW